MNLKQRTILCSFSLMLFSKIDLSSQIKQYQVVDEFKSSIGLVYYIENSTMEDDKNSENKWFERKVNLKCFLENQIIIQDSLLLRFEFPLRPEEYSIYDEIYYKADTAIVKLNALHIVTVNGTQTISKTSTELKSESVSITTPSYTEMVTNTTGETSNFTIPQKTHTETINVPTKHTVIETSPLRFASIYIKLNQEDIKRILNSRNLKFRIYTNRGGSTIELNRFELNGLIKFMERCGG
jgi:hypothetical protein